MYFWIMHTYSEKENVVLTWWHILASLQLQEDGEKLMWWYKGMHAMRPGHEQVFKCTVLNNELLT